MLTSLMSQVSWHSVQVKALISAWTLLTRLNFWNKKQLLSCKNKRMWERTRHLHLITNQKMLMSCLSTLKIWSLSSNCTSWWHLRKLLHTQRCQSHSCKSVRSRSIRSGVVHYPKSSLMVHISKTCCSLIWRQTHLSSKIKTYRKGKTSFAASICLDETALRTYLSGPRTSNESSTSVHRASTTSTPCKLKRGQTMPN